MSDHLPHEIWIEILARLPVKDLLRFRSVCKSWNSLITNPSFITTHLNQTLENTKIHGPDKLLLRLSTMEDEKARYLLCPDDESLGDEYVEIGFPFQRNSWYFHIVGSCNGLICLSGQNFADEQSIIVWNPSIRKSFTLQEPQPWNYTFIYGFGSTKSNEFKLVRIVYGRDRLTHSRLPSEVAVYCQGAASWRAVASLGFRCMVEFTGSQVFLNGAVHWAAFEPLGGKVMQCSGLNMIMVFDMGDEVFKEMSLPPVLANDRLFDGCPSNMYVATFRGSLAVFTAVNDVWVMKDYGDCESWAKLYSVRIPDMTEKDLVFGFRRNGELLLKSRDNWILSYDPETKEISNTGISGSSFSNKVDAYMETMLLFDGQDAPCNN